MVEEEEREEVKGLVYGDGGLVNSESLQVLTLDAPLALLTKTTAAFPHSWLGFVTRLYW